MISQPPDPAAATAAPPPTKLPAGAPRAGLALAGAAAGGALGYALFLVLARQGLYALVLPGALAGAGGGLMLGRRSAAFGAVCGLLALGVGIFTEWRFAPFIKDPGFLYFLGHLHLLRRVTQLLILVGAALGFWLGQGREPGAERGSRENS